MIREATAKSINCTSSRMPLPETIGHAHCFRSSAAQDSSTSSRDALAQSSAALRGDVSPEDAESRFLSAAREAGIAVIHY
ncbi:DUF982 domain-containing protein [Rhizobium sp. ARZ01]|nr:DUF982 domain-containing protein [Rhizobium sp. ARZ01]